jgi:endonuclease/exonuclease/phosphatase family metal-dependent hydrolase
MPAEGVLRVATLNVGSLLEPAWDERRHEVVAWLDRIDADLVCLQEVWWDAATPSTAGWIVEHTPTDRWHRAEGGFPFPSDLWPDPSLRFGSAILSRWPIDQDHLVALPLDARAEVPHPTYRMQAELLHARTHGFDVFSTHLAPPPAQAYHRRVQVLAIDEEVRRLADPGALMPPILCGDFNAEPDSDEMRFLCSLATLEGRSTSFQDAWRTVPPSDPGYTDDGRTNPLADLIPRPRKRIDYVLVGDAFLRKGGAGLVERAELWAHQPLLARLPSDHYGVLAEVRWPQRGADDA